MKVEIMFNGELKFMPENETEKYAIDQWIKNHVANEKCKNVVPHACGFFIEDEDE